jgi:hypothetical protein
MGAVSIVLACLLLLAQRTVDKTAPVHQQVEHARELIQSGKTHDALRELRAIVNGHPEDPEAQFETGVLLQELAGITFERIVRVAPELNVASNKKASDRSKAFSCLDRATSYSPTHSRVQYNRG